MDGHDQNAPPARVALSSWSPGFLVGSTWAGFISDLEKQRENVFGPPETPESQERNRGNIATHA